MKGKGGFSQYKDNQRKVKHMVKEIVNEHPQIQKAAYEAKYSAQQLEKLFSNLYDFCMSLSDIVGGLVTVLEEKGTFNREDFDRCIEHTVEQKKVGVYDLKVRSLGWGDPIEVVGDHCLVLVKIGVSLDNKMLDTYPKDLFLITSKTYLFPGLEDQLVGMKKKEKNVFSLVMPKQMQVVEIQGKELHFDVEILDVRGRVKKINEIPINQ